MNCSTSIANLVESRHSLSPPRITTPTFTLLGETFREEVTLSNHFPQETPLQGSTGACAMFASVALMEHACRGILSSPIKLSEGYSTYRNALKQIQGVTSWPPHKLDPNHTSSIYSGAHPSEILKDMLAGNICRESRLRFHEDFIPLTKALQKELSAPQVGLVKNKLEEVFGSIATPAKGGTDPEMSYCLSQLAEPISYPPDGILSLLTLLEKGVPFVCTAVGHANLIMGYRKRPDSPDTIEWLIRDSHHNAPRWRKSNLRNVPCTRVDVLFSKDQEKQFRGLVEARRKQDQANARDQRARLAQERPIPSAFESSEIGEDGRPVPPPPYRPIESRPEVPPIPTERISPPPLPPGFFPNRN